MRIIFLNTWQGKIFTDLKKFLEDNLKQTDIFCFQEVSPELFLKISKVLSGFYGQHDVGGIYYPKGLWYGQAIFSIKGINVGKTRKSSIFNDENNKVGFIQHLALEVANKKLFIGNIHGTPLPGDKSDTDLRINQSQRIIELLKKIQTAKIFGGDFNLLPNTKSIKLIEKAGYRNLIKEFNIKLTRNELSWKYHSKHSSDFVKQHYADYLFVSPEIKVKSFKVPYVEVSDHLPMILDFEI